ncbi:MAG: SMP-30/gluconolactonase/LRE family protein [Candidatus Hydrogenedentes bacterium]|nr:SMP-30/gluconolactonase/LRE family protein [Candidatus Hydrogenedentota bacterium]
MEQSNADAEGRRARGTASVVLGLVIVAVLAWLIFGPSEIDPIAWTPPEAPSLTGQFAQNNVLDSIELRFRGQLLGPEDIARDKEGRFYTGLANGSIVRIARDLLKTELLVNTGGRPLGMEFDAQGNLIVCDAHKGLLSIDPEGKITTLSTEEGGVPFGFTDDLAIATDGTIYFTDASYKFHAPNYLADLMEHRGNGKFLKYDPATKTTTKLIGDLCFANGVALSPDESFALVNETWKYRVLRYWLTGDKKDTWDVFIDNLPGFPDNVSSNGKGTFWLALANPRNAAADGMAPYPLLRRVVWKLPKAMHPAAVRYSFVLGLDARGKVIHNLQGPGGSLAPVTSANEYDGKLFLGSVEDSQFGVFDLAGLR